MSNPIQNTYIPDVVSPPGETLLEILRERGMSQAELAERTGRPKKTINEIIKGKAALTPETAIQLERVLGTPSSFWNNREQNFREWLARQDERKSLAEYIPWMKKFPLRAMIKMGWITESDDTISQLEELLRYLAVASPIQWHTMLQGTQWRQSATFAADPAAVTVWLRQGQIQAGRISCAPYDETRFREALHQIRELTTQTPQSFIKQMTGLCAQAGVAVVFVPEIPGTRTCGATRWLTSNKALIMLSLRYKTDDHLWFTFFHEAAHILLHGKREVFLEDADEVSEDVYIKEVEADRFAAEFLIPSEEIERFLPGGEHYSHEDIVEFARHLGIAPGIVVGRMQHDGILPPQNFNRLKQRFHWVIEKDEKL
ncbi:ImmA/IrrE family metallo-endopeptidase [bacterium]|nr:MAG: ImmA/IrrE family metallo-endopeptidase [bacterium]